MKQFKIAFNGRFSGTLRPTGTQTVAFNLFDAIIRLPREFDIVAFADPQFSGVGAWAGIPRTQLIPTPFAGWSRPKAQLWEQSLLPIKVRQLGCAMVHHPMATCPRWSLGTTTVVTLHDLNFYHHPEWVSPAFRRWLMLTAVPGMRKAAHVTAISDYVLADARKTLGLAPDKSSRIYNGLKPMALRPESATISGSKKNPPTILGVNLWQPHKNLGRLIAAVAELQTDFPGLELHLAGRPQAQFQDQPGLQDSLKAPFIRILGYLTDEALAQAYASASVCCYPSLEEGFGLPILEAMAMNTPVATSNTSCLPEIAGGAAVLFDPLSEKDIARALRDALRETDAQREIRLANGRAVAARFSWIESAKQYVQLYARLLS